MGHSEKLNNIIGQLEERASELKDVNEFYEKLANYELINAKAIKALGEDISTVIQNKHEESVKKLYEMRQSVADDASAKHKESVQKLDELMTSITDDASAKQVAIHKLQKEQAFIKIVGFILTAMMATLIILQFV